MELTSEQKFAVDTTISSIRDKKASVIKIAGYAGTGKTSIIQFIRNVFPNFKVCAYTGKAVDVLKRKRIYDSSTIHSLIYKPLVDSHGNVEFVLNDDISCGGVIVDESSMLSKELYEDLRYFGIPLILIGDHGQLPPVSSEAFNIMENPDIRLETVHRNAGDIAFFAEHIRKGNHVRQFPPSPKISFVFDKRDERFDRILLESDQIICAYNKTRVEINARIRQLMGYGDELLVAGERIMCLRNNKMIGLFNGMQGLVLDVTYKRRQMFIDFESSNGVIYQQIPVDHKQFGKEKPEFDYDPGSPHPFEYAYCATCHKSQGDEWNKVCVIEQVCKHWDHRRWAYTAASRAKEKIWWVLS